MEVGDRGAGAQFRDVAHRLEDMDGLQTGAPDQGSLYVMHPAEGGFQVSSPLSSCTNPCSGTLID